MSIRYEMIIYGSDEDHSFVVEVPELPGRMADGETYEDAVVNAKQVIEEWIETARDFSQANAVPVSRVVNPVRDISRERSEGSRRRRLSKTAAVS